MNMFKKMLSFNMGALLTMISAISAAVYGSLIKELTSNLRFSTILAIKNFLQVLVMIIFTLVTKKSFFPSEKPEMKMLALRAISSSMVAFTGAISYSYLPMFDTFAFLYSGSLVFGVTIGIFYFKEKFEYFKMFIILFLFLGSILVSKPSFIFGGGSKVDTKYAIGMVALVICAMSQSVCEISVKRMQETYTHLIVLYSGVCGMVIAAAFYPIRNSENVVPTYNQIILILAAVVVFILYLSTEISALKKIQFIKFQIFLIIDLPTTFLIDYFWFDTEVDVFRWAGFVCIVVALLANAVHEYNTQSSEVHEEIAGNTDAEISLLSN